MFLAFSCINFFCITKRVTIVMWFLCTLKGALLKSKVKLYLTVIRNPLSYLGSRSRFVGFSNVKANFHITL